MRDPHQSTSLTFGCLASLMWRGGISVPVFWATVFARDQLTATGASTDWLAAVARLAQRQTSWRAKASPLVFRGFLRCGRGRCQL